MGRNSKYRALGNSYATTSKTPKTAQAKEATKVSKDKQD